MALNDQYLIPGLFPFSRLCGNPGAVKHGRIMLIMFLNSKFIYFVELIKFYGFLPKITVLSETISREMFYCIG